MSFDANQLLGLLYLTLGVSSFFILFLTFRNLANRPGGVRRFDESGRRSWVKKEKLQLVEIHVESHDVKTFRFRRTAEQTFPPFEPGQFLTFQIGDDDKLTRSYSISSSATNRLTVDVAIKKIAGGKGSSWFHTLKVGQEVWAIAPSGIFTDAKLNLEKRVYLAGGIGITPLLSMIETNIDAAKTCEMHLVYGIRSRNDLAFHRRLEFIADRHSQLKYYPIYSHDPDHPGDKGFVTFDNVKKKIKLDDQTHFFICGPSVMSDKLVNDLLEAGIPEERVHVELFSSPLMTDFAKIPKRAVNITVAGRQYAYDGNQTILDFLEASGVEISSACRTGVCGTCKCEPSVPVESLSNHGLTLSERRQGLALSCVSFPLTDVEIKVVN